MLNNSNNSNIQQQRTKIEELVQQIQEDLFDYNDKWGPYNVKFAKDYVKYFNSIKKKIKTTD